MTCVLIITFVRSILSSDVCVGNFSPQRLNDEMRGLNKQIELLRREVNEKSHELHNIEHLIGLKVFEDVT